MSEYGFGTMVTCLQDSLCHKHGMDLAWDCHVPGLTLVVVQNKLAGLVPLARPNGCTVHVNDWIPIIESADSISKDGLDTPIYVIQYKSPKNSALKNCQDFKLIHS